ncbi:hypothetical protein ACG9WQ_010150 [Acinetobacter variabilis]|uniref:hypothetical protein n=1 Tax=Acinetobacter variabilis TaxID=70346 RepID=UPI003AF504FF
MDLFYILLNLNEFPANYLIYAELPWTLESKATSIDKNSKPELNLNINNIEYSYFLDVAMARKLLQVYSTNNVCLADTCQRVIEYVLREQN